jgi:hypothetical protein
MLENGRYRARGVEGALGVAKTGTEQVAVLLEVVEGDDMGARITWFGHFTEKATERTLESLRHLGWQGDDITDLSGIERNVVEIVVEHEVGNDGVPRARVRWINRGGGGGIAMKERMDQGAAAALAKRIKGKAVASRVHALPEAPTSQHRTTKAAPKQATGTNDARAFDDDF